MAKFLSNINLETANDIQFKTTAGANAGKISQTGDDLVISNAVGDILLGNGSDDVFIGDGTNTVDIRFEQDMAIFADSSSTRTLTLGGTNTNLVLESPSISGTMTLGSTTINNKLTFTGSSGYILFDYEPSGDTDEYTTEVPLLKFDHNGTEKTILSRISENGAIQLGHDDTVLITAGDVGDVMKTNWGATNEAVVLAAENGFYAYGFPSNTHTWANRNEFRFRSDSATPSDNGLYIGDGGNTQFIDLSRNLTVNNITATGNINNINEKVGTSVYLRNYELDTGGSGGSFLIGKIEDSSSTDGAISATVHFAYDYGTTTNNCTLHFNFAQRSGTARGTWWYEADDQDAANDRVHARLIDDGSGNMYVWITCVDYSRVYVEARHRFSSNFPDSGALTAATITSGTTLFDTANDPTAEMHVGNVFAHGEVEATSLDINGDADISGTISTATWNGAVIASAYLDSDTAHLSTSQTFTGAKTMQGNLTLDDGNGDTPTLRFINGDDDVYQFFNDSSSDMKLTRTNNGGVDYNFNAHETDYTQSILQIGGSSTFGTDVTIAGNLTVNGTTVTVDTTNLNVQDKNITLNYSTSDSSSSANGAGITIQDAVNSSTDATILWDTSANTFKISHPINVLGNILTSGTVDGRDLQTDGTKLDTIDTNANAYVHPTNAGNKHIPAAGATGQFLQYAGSAGTAQWATLTSSDVGLGNVANVDQRNASNINNGTLGASFLPTTISSNTSGSAASLSGLSLGDIVYGGESGFAKLGGNAQSSNKFLRSRGAANTATEPEWVQVGYSDLTGTVPTWNQNTTGSAATLSSTLAVNRGGTGATSLDAAGIVEKTGSQTIAGTKTFTGSLLLDDGTGASPTMRFMNADDDEVSIFCNSSGKMKFQQKLVGGSNVVQMTMDENGLDVVNGLKVGTGTTITTILDEDNMASDSATALATQQSIKAYVDSEVSSAGGGTMSSWNLDSDANSAGSITNGTTVSFDGGTGITTSRSGSTITITNSAPMTGDTFDNDGTFASLRAQGTTKGDVGLGSVENTALSTYTGNGGALDNQYITNGAGYTTNTGTTTASNSQTFTNKSGNISQWTNDSGYTTNTGTTTASNTQTFTNKTIDANGTGNSITNIDIGNMTAAVIVTESEGIGNNDNDTTIPTSAAVVDYVANNSGGSGLPTAPGSDKILIYDHSAGEAKWATPNNNLAILGTQINATDTNTWQANTDTQAGYVAAGGLSNKVWKTNGAGVPGWRADSDTNTTYTAGTLLDLSSTQFNVDLTEATAATIAAGDNIIFIDGGATGTQSKGSIDDVATLFAGGGLTATSGVLSVNLGHGLSLDVDTIKLFPNNNITVDSNGISVSDDIFNTNLRIGRGGTGMYMDYKTESDAITIRTDHANSASASDGNRKFEFTNGGIFRSLGTQVLNYTGWSDKRLKENIKNLNYGLDAIMKLRPVSYDWKKEVDADKTNSLGFIAQEVEKVIPELVTESKTIFDDKKAKGVDYVKMVAVLTKAIQEQQKQIEELKEIINGNS